jgi:hypothetical protein
MTYIHVVAIGVSTVILIITSIYFLQKKWSFWKFYTTLWIGMTLFGFGILPTQFPEWSLSWQIIYMIVVSIIGYFFLKWILNTLIGDKLNKKT